jgi:outer membrane protein assembly factor BamD (BamD/ComL family)
MKYFWILMVLLPRMAFSSAELSRAEFFLEKNDNAQAAQRLYDIVSNSKYKDEHTKALYSLSKALTKMGYNQSAVYFLTAIARYNAASKYMDASLEALYEIGFQIGDESALKYALSKIDIQKFPSDKKDLLYYRLGEVYLEKNDFKNAVGSYSRITSDSKLFSKSRYNIALAYAESKNPKMAVKYFTQAANARRKNGVVDTQRVGALIGRARAFYQMGRWDDAIKAYKSIPRDSEFWHEALFESTWAYLRSGRFRSAMSNFQSLHSKFYESYFLPESLVLRSIVYLYICKYDEVDKVLKSYDELYGKLQKQIATYLREKRDTKEDLIQMNKMLAEISKGQTIAQNYSSIPGLSLRHISRSASFKKHYKYLKLLYDERALNSNQNDFWKRSALGKQIAKNITQRIAVTEKFVSNLIRKSLIQMNEELLEFSDQKEFIKVEVTTAKTEGALKKMRGTDDPSEAITAKNSRDFYISNGYEYWPFQGEYWLDEIGNYQYVGVSQCTR